LTLRYRATLTVYSWCWTYQMLKEPSSMTTFKKKYHDKTPATSIGTAKCVLTRVCCFYLEH
jgi:hypothetical protein